jgi:hypothetical protein
MARRVIVAGAGASGRVLADRLAARHPVLLVDRRAEAFGPDEHPLEPAAAAARLTGRNGLGCVLADASSRLVLEALFDPDLECALVAATGSDAVNLEAGRLGRGLGFDPVIAAVRDPARAAEFTEQRITAVDAARLVADQLERSLEHSGALLPTGIGLGRGELLEIRLLPTSPILDRRLASLAPQRWRVAAVFRGDELIVPTGETRLQADDRVLLVGDPQELAGVAAHLRLGTPRFPQQFGPRVVTLEWSGADAALAAEAEALAAASRASGLVRGLPQSAAEPTEGTAPAVERSRFAPPAPEAAELAEALAAQRPGVVVCRARGRSRLAGLLGRRSRDAALCDRIAAPVLFARGRSPYQRILLPVSESVLSLRAAETAIDLSRQLGAALTAINVDLPHALSGLEDDELHREVVPVRRLCELFEVPLDYRHRTGNPIRELVAESERHQLMVVSRHQHSRDTYFDPDVALRLAQRARCSVLVLTLPRG